jgi:GNAT superfamily N-acetyltransferase
VKLLEKAIDICKERKMPGLSPKPLLGCPAYDRFFLNHGFARNEEHPEGLWMRKSLKDIQDFIMPKGVAITFTDDLDKSGFTGELARLEADIALEQHGLEVKLEENVLALRKEMVEVDVVYGIARMDSAVAGYSRTVLADLLSGGRIVKNRGLAVRKDCRNRGIGEALLLSSMEMVRNKGHNEMFISTHSRNPARRLYERVGFEVIETVPSLILRLD